MLTKTQNTPHLYGFTLGREWKLSLAELFAIFGQDSYREHTENVAIFQIVGYSREQLQKKFLTIGGSIRIIEILGTSTPATFPTDVIGHILSTKPIGKVQFALGAYNIEFRLSDIGLRIKKTLAEKQISSRLINTENANINAASFKKSHLGKSGHEYTLLALNANDIYIGRTIACQDIDAYAQRDTGKSRDMIVGMMPPKLTQMMIQLALKGNKASTVSIYDPFCGLGTTLIEGANMGIIDVYGSDISADMVRLATQSLDAFTAEEMVWQERILKVGGTPNKDFRKFSRSIIELDARDIHLAPKKLGFKNGNLPLIVSEGYLGEIMSPRDISLEKVQSERKKLAILYNDFFTGITQILKTNPQEREAGVYNKDGAPSDFCIVMSFPFWNIHGTYSYFTEIYDILERKGFIVDSLLPGEMGLNTRKGSILYKRENQTVGREILRIIKR